MDINELRERRLKLIADARAQVERAEAEDRDFTAEEEANSSKMWDEINALAKRMERLETVDSLSGERDGFTSRKVTGESQNAATKAVSDSNSHGDIFRRYLSGGREAISPKEFRDLSASVGAEGGYLVAPEKFVNELIVGIGDKAVVRQYARVFQLRDAASLGAPAIDDPASDAEWTSELTNATPDTALTFQKRTLTPSPLSKVIKVSERLLRLSVLPIETLVIDAMAGKLAEAEEKGYLIGTGTNQPLGMFTASADGISTARDIATGNTATAVTFDGLVEAKFALKSGYQNSAKWILHRQAVKMISKVKDNDGQYLWEPSRQANTPDRLLGNEVIWSEYAPNTFTAGLYVGLIGDLSYYWIAESLAVNVKRLDELFALTNQVGFRVRKEVDGMPVLEEAFARVQLAAL
jgi:HK97 family phage major capsid protein